MDDHSTFMLQGSHSRDKQIRTIGASLNRRVKVDEDSLTEEAPAPLCLSYSPSLRHKLSPWSVLSTFRFTLCDDQDMMLTGAVSFRFKACMGSEAYDEAPLRVVVVTLCTIPGVREAHCSDLFNAHWYDTKPEVT